MIKLALSLLSYLALAALLLCQMATVDAQADAAQRQWSLKWRDDFQCPAAGAPGRSAGGLDLGTWSFDIGTRDTSDPANPGPENWGNNEPQYYTDRPENAAIKTLPDGSCALVLRAVSEEYQGMAYTSARITSKGHQVAGAIVPPRDASGNFIDGGAVRVEMRVQVPEGTVTGTWPAFWMLPTTPAYGIWPFSGEIDILEGSGFQEEFVCGVHFGGPWEHRANLATRTNCPRPDRKDAAAAYGPCRGAFRTWALEWGVSYADGAPVATLVWFIDGAEVKRLSSERWWTNVEGSAGAQRVAKPMAPFDQPFHVILNLAVGGSNFAGFPPPGPYEQEFKIAYVQVEEHVPAP